MDDRKDALENKHARDEEFRFKVSVRTVKLFGAWVAGQMGIKSEDAVAVYVDELLDHDFKDPDPKDVLVKAQKDLADKGVTVTLHHLDNQYNLHADEARRALEK